LGSVEIRIALGEVLVQGGRTAKRFATIVAALAMARRRVEAEGDKLPQLSAAGTIVLARGRGWNVAFLPGAVLAGSGGFVAAAAGRLECGTKKQGKHASPPGHENLLAAQSVQPLLELDSAFFANAPD
jgi:hypothetical protein